MIHLFNKIYLKPRQHGTQAGHRILLTPEHHVAVSGEQVMVSMGLAHYEVPFLADASYAALIDRSFDHDEHAFFAALINWPSDVRLVIEASITDIFLLHAKWLKTILPQWTHAQYREYVNFFILRWRALDQLGRRTLADDRLQPLDDAQRVELQACILTEELNRQWECVTPWVTTAERHNQILATTSLELQLPTLIHQPNWPYADQVKAKLVGVVKRALYLEFSEHVAKPLVRSLVNFSLMEPDVSYDFFKDDLYSLASAHPDYRFLVDERFTKPQSGTSDDFEYFESTYGLSSLEPVVRKAAQWFPDLNVQLVGLFKNDLSYEDILEHGLMVFEHQHYQDSINHQLMALILCPENNLELDALQAKKSIVSAINLQCR